MKFGKLENLDDIQFDLPDLKVHPHNLKQELRVNIGCSLWTDTTFIGKYYPHKTPKTKLLNAYGQQFTCVEVNGTRFGTPKLTTLQKWKDQVPEGFKFCVKVPQVITHRKNMVDEAGLAKLDEFLLAMHEFEPVCGLPYIVLPNYFTLNKLTMLQNFLDKIPVDFPFGIEIRNETVLKSHAFIDSLLKKNMPLIITDTPGRRDVIHKHIIGGTLFVRFVGGNLHQSDYKRIDLWVNEIKSAINQDLKQVYFFIHQHEPLRYHAADLCSYMIIKLNKEIPTLNLKSPTNHTSN